RSLEQAHARLPRAGATFADARRCAECRIRISRSAPPRLRDTPDRSARHHPPAEDDTGSRARALHALQGLLTPPRLLPVEAQPPGRPAHHQDLGERSAVDLVAGRALTGYDLRPILRGRNNAV